MKWQTLSWQYCKDECKRGQREQQQTWAHRPWLCSASADVMMGYVYVARLVAVLVVRCVCAASVRVL